MLCQLTWARGGDARGPRTRTPRGGGHHTVRGCAAQWSVRQTADQQVPGSNPSNGAGHRHRGDSSPCGQSPVNFYSITLITRSRCRRRPRVPTLRRLCRMALYRDTMHRLALDVAGVDTTSVCMRGLFMRTHKFILSVYGNVSVPYSEGVHRVYTAWTLPYTHGQESIEVFMELSFGYSLKEIPQ